jgi:hypothetical protein
MTLQREGLVILLEAQETEWEYILDMMSVSFENVSGRTNEIVHIHIVC